MTLSSTGRVARAVLAFVALAFCAAPVPGDVGGCNQKAEELDAGAFFASKARVDCAHCADCALRTDACQRACDGATQERVRSGLLTPGARRGGVSARARRCFLQRLSRIHARQRAQRADRVRLLPGERAMRRQLLALAMAWLVGGCALSNRMVASRDDYALYRRTRVAETPAERLGAGSRYLREQPNGRFRSEVRAWFEATEPRYLAEAHDRPSLLRAYLSQMPDGPHAQAVRDRLQEFDLLNEYRGKREVESERFVSRVEAELDKARSERDRFIQGVTSLVLLMAKTKSFGKPTSELDDTLIYRFRLESPVGRCDGDSCVKRFSYAYSVPTRSAPLPRTAELELGFELSQGLLRRVRLAGPELFSRLTEAVDRVLLDPKDLLGRTEAIARSIQILENTLEAELPSSECRRDVVAPVVLMRACRGVALTLEVGAEPGEPDRIEVTASP
ncbi:MAG: hypothetical protein QM756_30020 [Polyangiaceae bacterium]